MVLRVLSYHHLIGILKQICAQQMKNKSINLFSMEIIRYLNIKIWEKDFLRPSVLKYEQMKESNRESLWLLAQGHLLWIQGLACGHQYAVLGLRPESIQANIQASVFPIGNGPFYVQLTLYSFFMISSLEI